MSGFEKPKVLLVGQGAIGSVCAVALMYTGKSIVTSVVRSDYETLSTKGFEIDSCDYGHIDNFKPHNVCNDVLDAYEKHGPFDFILISTKNLPDISPLEEIIAPAVKDTKTCIILAQNGIGIEQPMFKLFPGNPVLSAVVMTSSVLRNGVVSHTLEDCMSIGYWDNGIMSPEDQETVCRKFLDIYWNDKNKEACPYDEKVAYTRWRKLIYNGTYNPICALVDMDVGALEWAGGTDELIRPAMDEVYAVAKLDGTDLPADLKEFFIHCDDHEYFKPSMAVDVEKGNYFELESIVGNFLKIAAKYDIKTPIISIVYKLLKNVQYRTKIRKGAVVLPNPRQPPPK